MPSSPARRKGLGRAITAGLAAEGVQVAIASRNHDPGREDRSRDQGRRLHADLSQAGAAEKLINEVNAKLGGIDILVANTGGQPPPTVFDGTSDARWGAAFENCSWSTVQMIRLALPGMKQAHNGDRIIVSGLGRRRGTVDGLTISNALRPSLHGSSTLLSREVGKDGITVSA